MLAPCVGPCIVGVTGLRLAVFLLTAFAVACHNDGSPALISRESERFSFTGFLDSVGKFPYEAGEKKRAHVTEGFGRLAPGMSMDEVAKLLGNPDAEFLHSKSAETGYKLAFTTWHYYLRRYEYERYKEGFDQAVFVHFKPSGEMYWADPAFTPGLKPAGSPDLHPEGALRATN